MRRFKFSVLALSAFVAAGCDNGESGTEPIVVSDAGALTQTVHADSSKGNSVVFSTTGAWTSDIVESTRAGADWISISPSEGKAAGNYTVSISVEPNTTGNSRAAKINILCGDGRITVEVTQTPDKEDGTPMVSLEEMIENSEELFYDAEAAFLGIDNQYASLESRQEVTASTAALYDFWGKSYAAIGSLTTLIVRTDSFGDISDQEKNEVKHTATARRAAVYFYLNTLFGGVPLTSGSGTPAEGLARSTAEEVRNFISTDLDTAIAGLPAAESLEPRLLKAKQAMAQGEYVQVTLITQAMKDIGLVLNDSNGDGMISADDSDALLTNQTLLLAAEAALMMGDTEAAIVHMHHTYDPLVPFPELPQGSDAERIWSALHGIYPNWNKGEKFLNNIRWDSADWGKHALLPIPQKAMEANDKLTQNTGW